MTIRGRIEEAFASWGRLVIRWRWVAILAVSLLTALLGSHVPQLRADNSEEAFLKPGDPERLRYDRFREQFDREDRVVVTVRAPEIFATRRSWNAEQQRIVDLERLVGRLTLELEVAKKVSSIFSPRSSRNGR